MADTKSRGHQFVTEFLRGPEGQRIARRLASAVPRMLEWAGWVVTMNEWIDRVHPGPNGKALFEDGKDWLFRPAMGVPELGIAPTCQYESIVDGKLTLEDIVNMNAIIEVQARSKAPTTARSQRSRSERSKKPGPQYSERDAAIRRMRQMRETLSWKKFASLIRDESHGWADQKKSTHKRGWSLRAIQEAYKTICYEK
jgi:hypothetical protein